MAFRIEPLAYVDPADQLVRLYRVTCAECSTVIATSANATESRAARRHHTCKGRQ